ncbi:MAG: sulfatase-like hydrolase/transferase, partial [Candidatus Marinimicrobia bacterium]|nr:sulfatase-like hydrolase/transferase [Candidatus Neomarinimicrobiota bacterium]
MQKQFSRRKFLKSAGILGVMSTVPFSLQKCASADEEYSRPNVLWITAEDISPALGCYGDEYANTPTLDALAEDGILYENAFATAPICAPARSSLITGIYATSLGTQHLRSDIPVPEDLKILPEYLREQGYFTTNNSKTDYNFDPSGRWDENGSDAHWRNRPGNEPFFSVFNYGITHEGHANRDDPQDVETLDSLHDPAEAPVPPYHPDTPEMRDIWAHQYDLISVLDQRVKALLNQLKEDGLAEDTIVFFFADHGFGQPRYKRWMYNTGIQVPFIVHVPQKFRRFLDTSSGEQRKELVSFIDFAPTVLNLCQTEIPGEMVGQTFLGLERDKPRKFVYGARSRADDIYDVSRAIRDERYIYIRNYMPHRSYIR